MIFKEKLKKGTMKSKIFTLILLFLAIGTLNAQQNKKQSSKKSKNTRKVDSQATEKSQYHNPYDHHHDDHHHGNNHHHEHEHHHHDGHDDHHSNPYPEYPMIVPMNPANFQLALTTLGDESFEDDKLALAKQIALGNYLTSNQIAAILKEFSFESSKLDFAKFAYLSCVDPENYFLMNRELTFSSSKEDLNAFIQNSIPK